jgi:hypothetical protein
LSQNKTEIQKFFEQFSSLIPKALFVIVNYQKDSMYSIRELKEEYGLNSDNIEIIPKNRNFSAACENGDMEVYFSYTRYHKDSQKDKLFTTSIKKIAKKINMRGVCLCAEKRKNE